MRRLLQVAACSTFLSLFSVDHPASAQQNGNGSGYNWSGFYGGGNLGGAFGGSDFLSSIGKGVPFFEGEFYEGFPNSATPGIIAAYRSNDGDFSSFTGGLQAGYNFWAGGLLLGIEADINFLNANVAKTTSATGFNDPKFGQATYAFRSEIDANYIASLRPRIGIPVAGMLLYATGGVALTTLKYEHSFRGTGGFYAGGPDITESASVSETKVGWTLGAGVEIPLGPNVALRTEYSYTDFGSVSSNGNKISPLTSGPNPPDFACGVNTGQGGPFFGDPTLETPRQCFNHKADLTLHSIRMGLNFKF